jgi:glycolate oxidase
VQRALNPSAVDAARRELSRELGGDRVIADPDLLERYGEDASGAERRPPDLLVRADKTEDVVTVLRIATKHRLPVTPRGLGSGKSGGCIPIFGGIVLSLERMNKVKEVNRADMLVVSDPGTITAELMRTVEAEGLFYPPDPNSLNICSIGGNVACNAGGPRALKYGVTKNYVLELEVVLPTGAVIRVGKRTIKHVTGYDLASLIVGSEGTLGVITECTLRLIPTPAAVQTALVSFDGLGKASHAITAVLSSGIVPRTLEMLDHHALAAVRAKTPGRFPDNAGALLILETDGSSPERAFEDLERAASVCLDQGAIDVLVAQDQAQREKIWEPRRVLSMTLTETAPKKISEDIVVPRSLIPTLLEKVTRISEKHRIRVATYGHAGDGNLHVNVLFDEASADRAHLTVEEIMVSTIELGGTISGEHGIGLTKRDFLPLEHEPAKIEVQRALKRTLDPADILNPGKILPLKGVRE